MHEIPHRHEPVSRLGGFPGAGRHGRGTLVACRANASDAEIMEYARRHDLVVLTHDLDFSAILAATRGDKPSVVQIRAEDVSTSAIGGRVIEALLQMATYLEQGALLSVDPKRARLRLLPLMTK